MKLLQFFFSNLISSQQKGSFIFRTSTPKHLTTHNLNLCSLSYLSLIKMLIKIPAWLSSNKRLNRGTIEHLKDNYISTLLVCLPPILLQLVQSWFQLYQEDKSFISCNLRSLAHLPLPAQSTHIGTKRTPAAAESNGVKFFRLVQYAFL